MQFFTRRQALQKESPASHVTVNAVHARNALSRELPDANAKNYLGEVLFACANANDSPTIRISEMAARSLKIPFAESAQAAINEEHVNVGLSSARTLLSTENFGGKPKDHLPELFAATSTAQRQNLPYVTILKTTAEALGLASEPSASCAGGHQPGCQTR